MMRLIKVFLVTLLLFIGSCGLWACSSQPVATDSLGHPIRLKDYKGQWVLINYWATWCAPCLDEMFALNTLYHKYQGRLMVLGVSYDHLDNQQIIQIAKKRQIDYPLLSVFPLEQWGIRNLPVLPMTFVLDPQGRLVKTIQGPRTEAQFQQLTVG